MIKGQHCCTGSGTRLVDSQRMRNYEHLVDEEIRVLGKDKVIILWDFSI